MILFVVKKYKKFIRGEEGATLYEYALVIVCVILLAVVALTLIGAELLRMIMNFATAL